MTRTTIAIPLEPGWSSPSKRRGERSRAWRSSKPRASAWGRHPALYRHIRPRWCLGNSGLSAVEFRKAGRNWTWWQRRLHTCGGRVGCRLCCASMAALRW